MGKQLQPSTPAWRSLQTSSAGMAAKMAFNTPSLLVTAGLTTVSSAVPPHHLCWTAADRETGVDQTEAE